MPVHGIDDPRGLNQLISHMASHWGPVVKMMPPGPLPPGDRDTVCLQRSLWPTMPQPYHVADLSIQRLFSNRSSKRTGVIAIAALTHFGPSGTM